MHCITSPEAPWPAAAFTSARYATLAVDFDATPLDVQSSWQVWARDEQARPVVLAHSQRRVVCLLMRPDSLMSDELARGVLRHCLQFASLQGSPLR